MDVHFEFHTGLRGFHVYSNTINSRPYVGQKLTFKREHDNRHDKFAVAGKTMVKGKIGLIIVGHIPRELSRYTWYAIQEEVKFEAVVHEAKPKLSPLVQGGLEIPMKVTVTWAKVKKLSILVAKVEEIEYPITEEYTDYSQDILAELGAETQEDDEDDDPTFTTFLKS